MSNSIKYILTTGVFLIVIAGFYYVLTSDILTVRAYRAEEVEQWAMEIDKEILSNLKKADSIQFNTEVLETNTYQSLINTRVELSEPSVTRNNPFEPVTATQAQLQ